MRDENYDYQKRRETLVERQAKLLYRFLGLGFTVCELGNLLLDMLPRIATNRLARIEAMKRHAKYKHPRIRERDFVKALEHHK